MVKPSNLSDIDHIEKVKVTTIDNFISLTKPPSFIRMDVEGFEVKVVQGMSQILKYNHPLKLFIELHPQIIGANPTIDMLQTLKHAGFKTHTVISRDTYIRQQLKQVMVNSISIDQLIEHPGITGGIHSFEVFFAR